MKTKKIIWIIAIYVILLFLSYFISEKLITGGRWATGQALGGVDNWLYENGTFYPKFGNEITPGISYFPGIIILSLICRVVFGYGAEAVIIILCGIFSIFLFWGFAVIATDKAIKRIVFLIISILFFAIEFESARFYILEMHPDLISVMFFLWGIICVDRFLNLNNKLKFYLSTILLFLLSGLFKQNAVFLFLGLGFFVLFSKKFSNIEKFHIFMSEIIAGIGVLLIVTSIEGCWENCITVNSLHKFMNYNQYISYLKLTLKNNLIFIVGTILYFVLLLSNNIHIKRKLEEMWLASSISWCGFGMLASAKGGANGGNMEASIIVMMPFVLILLENIVNNDFINNIVLSFLNKRYILIVLFMILALILLNASYNNYKQYFERVKCERTFATWLTNNYYNKNVAYNTLSYELLNNADINKKMDFYTAGLWRGAGLINDDKVSQISKFENWDIIIFWKPLYSKSWPKTFRNFKKLNPSSYPRLSKYYRNNIEIYIKNS